MTSNNIFDEAFKIDNVQIDPQLFEFFEPSYAMYQRKFSQYNENVDIILAYYLKLGDEIICNCKFYKDYAINRYSCLICGNNYMREPCTHINQLIYTVNKLHKDDIIADYNKIIFKQKEAERIKKQNIFIEEFDKINQDIDDDDVDFSAKVSIIPSIKNDELELKVKRNKAYIIKDVAVFLDMFLNNEYKIYGKELAFIHNEEILDDKSKKVLNLVSRGKINNYNKRYVQLSPGMLIELLNIYKDDYLELNDRRYFVRLDKINYKIKIDKDFIATVIFDKNIDYIYQNKSAIIAISDGNIDLLNGDKTINAFANSIKNVEEYGISVKEILDKLVDGIYAKYPEYFDIDPEIIDKFRLSDITINAYFDFENNKILLNTAYIKNDEEIQENVVSQLASRKFRKYKNLINGYHFVDNVISNDSDILNFLSSDFSNLREICNVYLSDNLENKKISIFEPPILKIQNKDSIANVFFENINYSEQELRDILKAIRRKKKYILLKNDTIVRLDNDDATQFENLVKDMQIDDKELLHEKRVPLYQVFKLENYKDNVRLDEKLSNIINEISNFKNQKYDFPNLNATLRKYQKEAFLWLKTLAKYKLGGILADDMGLGKTIEMISFIVSNNNEKPSFIVSPKSLIFNWQNEFARFAPDIEIIPVYGQTDVRNKLIKSIKSNKKVVYITSYETLRMDIDKYENIDFETIILDEGQFIKNVHAKKTISVKKLTGDYKFVLTGTPIENNIVDLWSIFDFIMPGYLLPLSEFADNYEKIEGYQQILALKVAPFILRRTKNEVLKDLPSKYEVIISCQMYEEQKKLYDAMKLQANDLLNDGKNTIALLSFITRLRQICVDPSMFVDNYASGSGKIDELESIISDRINDGHRILIFSQFVKALEIIKKRLNIKKINYYMITGDTSAKERIDICNDFNNNTDIKVVLISLKAGGTGLNLVGADCVIHVDPWWNVAAQNQATDRAHRIGQVKNVEVIKLICENSIEQRVVELQNKKSELISKMISDDDSSITNLSNEDIAYIFK